MAAANTHPGTLNLSLAFPALLLALLAGCSCDDEPKQPEPCAVDSECASGLCVDASVCAERCTSASCGEGSYCSESGDCARDCGADAGACENGTCTADGRCLASTEDVDCPNIEVSAEPVIPTVVLLVDQSGSMTEEIGNNVTRWEAVYQALVNPTDGVIKELEAQVRFGMTLYSWRSNAMPAVGCPELQEVAPALNNYAALEQLLDDNSPLDDTPTAEAVMAVTASFPESDGPRVLLLATDGDPDSCMNPDSNGQQGPRTASEQAVQAAFTAGIETYVLSVGDDTTATHLDRLARAGRGQNLDTGTAEPFVATSQSALTSAFEEIIGGVRTCEFTLDGIVQAGYEDEGAVVLGGTPLAYGADYSLTNGNLITLLGEACDTFLETDSISLSATFPCGAVVPIL